MCRKLCNMPNLLAALSTSGSAVAVGSKKWSDEHILTPEAHAEILGELNYLEANAWRFRDVEVAPEVDIWTDASLTYAAYVICFRNRVIASYREEVPPQHIFYSELGIAIKALQDAHALGYKSVNLFIDNAPAGICVERGASSNFSANRALAKLPSLKTNVHWVPTDTEVADQFTRCRPDGTLQPLPAPGSLSQELTKYLRADPRVRALGNHTF